MNEIEAGLRRMGSDQHLLPMNAYVIAADYIAALERLLDEVMLGGERNKNWRITLKSSRSSLTQSER